LPVTCGASVGSTRSIMSSPPACKVGEPHRAVGMMRYVTRSMWKVGGIPIVGIALDDNAVLGHALDEAVRPEQTGLRA
jgi:hypothetical protein